MLHRQRLRPRGGSDADGNHMAYCGTAVSTPVVDAPVVDATVVDATVVDANATDPAAKCGVLINDGTNSLNMTKPVIFFGCPCSFSDLRQWHVFG